MSCNISIPVRIHDDFGDGLKKLINTAEKIESCNENEFVLDFSNAKHLNPFYLGGLACIMQHKMASGAKFSINHGQNSSITSYLDTIRFPATFSQSENHESDFNDAFGMYISKTYIPIITFETGSTDYSTVRRERVLTAVVQLLRNQLGFSSLEIIPVVYFLSELTDNINEHSCAPRGFVFAQYYKRNNYLDLCICDAGQGIMQSYLLNPKFDPQTEAEAMQMALNGRSTKDIAESRGFGISTTRNMLVNGLRGKIFIWSGKTIFIQTIEKEAIVTREKDSFFQGTFIGVRVPTIIPGSFKFYDFVEG